MKDIAAERPIESIVIHNVGISNFCRPFLFGLKTGDTSILLATINISVSLSSQDKGTHMSRFIQELMSFSQPITLKSLQLLLSSIKTTLESNFAKIEIYFTLPIVKESPISKHKSYMTYDCGFIIESNEKSILICKVPVINVCPCAIAITDNGTSHNQRCIISVKIKQKSETIWFEDLIALLESCGSSELYSLLKRTDEKHIVEQAHNNPKFVEDVVREVYKKLEPIAHIKEIKVEAMESIHDHTAFAVIKGGGNYAA